MEEVYAAHSNRLKSLASEARKASVRTKYTPYSPSAKKVYAEQAASLDTILYVALRNIHAARRSQLVANSTLTQKRQAKHDMEHVEIMKLQPQALAAARARTGSSKTRVD